MIGQDGVMADEGHRTTERVLHLLGLLQQRAVWTGPDLAERLGVTTRSVRRDVDRLRALGYPVNAAPGLGGGYQLGAGRALPPLLLDDAEAVATAVALRLGARGTVAGGGEAALRALAKLDQVLPARLREEVRALQSAISTLDGGVEEVGADLLLVLARATRDEVRVRVGYTDRDGAVTRRRLEPYGLVATGRRWYLMAWDLDREDWRTLRLDRMREPEATTWRFRPREHPDPAEHVQHAITVSAYRVRGRVRVAAPAAVVRARTTAASVRVEEVDDDTCVLHAGADDADNLARHLALLGLELEVLDPPELVAAVRRLGERMLRAAG